MLVNLFILFLLLIGTGFAAVWAYNFITCDTANSIGNALMFDVLILIINLIGLYIFKGFRTMDDLVIYFNCLHFTIIYAIINLILSIALAIPLAFIWKITHTFKCHKHNEKKVED